MAPRPVFGSISGLIFRPKNASQRQQGLGLAKPDIILVSTLKRAMQTASHVFEEFKNCPETQWIASDVIRVAIQ